MKLRVMAICEDNRVDRHNLFVIDVSKQTLLPLVQLQLETKVQPKVASVSGLTMVKRDAIRARHIYPPDKSGVSAGIVVAVALACFFGTLVLAILVAVIIIMKIKADAAQQLDRNLANLLISAASSKAAPSEAGKTSDAKKNSVVPAPCADMIQHQLETTDTVDDGKTDKNEFMQWAKDHNLNAKQAKLMWSDLDRDHNNEVDRAEWEKYIAKRPNLKWLATRLQSVARH